MMNDGGGHEHLLVKRYDMLRNIATFGEVFASKRLEDVKGDLIQFRNYISEMKKDDRWFTELMREELSSEEEEDLDHLCGLSPEKHKVYQATLFTKWSADKYQRRLQARLQDLSQKPLRGIAHVISIVKFLWEAGIYWHEFVKATKEGKLLQFISIINYKDLQHIWYVDALANMLESNADFKCFQKMAELLKMAATECLSDQPEDEAAKDPSRPIEQSNNNYQTDQQKADSVKDLTKDMAICQVLRCFARRLYLPTATIGILRAISSVDKLRGSNEHKKLQFLAMARVFQLLGECTEMLTVYGDIAHPVIPNSDELGQKNSHEEQNSNEICPETLSDLLYELRNLLSHLTVQSFDCLFTDGEIPGMEQILREFEKIKKRLEQLSSTWESLKSQNWDAFFEPCLKYKTNPKIQQGNEKDTKKLKKTVKESKLNACGCKIKGISRLIREITVMRARLRNITRKVCKSVKEKNAGKMEGLENGNTLQREFYFKTEVILLSTAQKYWTKEQNNLIEKVQKAAPIEFNTEMMLTPCLQLLRELRKDSSKSEKIPEQWHLWLKGEEHRLLAVQYSIGLLSKTLLWCKHAHSPLGSLSDYFEMVRNALYHSINFQQPLPPKLLKETLLQKHLEPAMDGTLSVKILSSCCLLFEATVSKHLGL